MTPMSTDNDVDTVNALRELLAELANNHGVELALDVAAVNIAHYAGLASKGQMRQKGLMLIVPDDIG